MPVILDSCFIAEMHRLASTCEFIEWIKEYLDEDCYIFKRQYSLSPCNGMPHPCADLHQFLSDEDAIILINQHSKAQHLNRIYNLQSKKDIFDLMAVLYALNSEEKTKIFSSDRRVLIVCKCLDIDHACLKKVFFDVMEMSGVNFFIENYFNTDFMLNPNELNPFVSFYKNSRCNDCSQNPCDFSKIIPINPHDKSTGLG